MSALRSRDGESAAGRPAGDVAGSGILQHSERVESAKGRRAAFLRHDSPEFIARPGEATLRNRVHSRREFFQRRLETSKRHAAAINSGP
mgnify:CR=1 FL=1